MTADEAIGRRDEESLGSVRQRLAALPREHWILLGILGLVVVVHGWRAVRPFFIGGDLLYHWGLTHTILLGTFPPEGPYIGLPAYYPPAYGYGYYLPAYYLTLPFGIVRQNRHVATSTATMMHRR